MCTGIESEVRTTYMWIGYSLDRQGGRQGVLYGAGGRGGVGPQNHGVRAGARPATSLKFYINNSIADKPNFRCKSEKPQNAAKWCAGAQSSVDPFIMVFYPENNKHGNLLKY